MSLRMCKQTIEDGYRKWTTSDKARVREAVDEVAQALKGQMP